MITIRTAGPDDHHEVARLLRQLGYDVTPELAHEKLAWMAGSEIDTALVTVKDGLMVGCMSLHALPLFHVRGNLGRITALVVGHEHRRQGVGEALIEASERWFISAGCVKIEVTSGDHREEAHQFYERYGYLRDGRRLSKRLGECLVCMPTISMA